MSAAGEGAPLAHAAHRGKRIKWTVFTGLMARASSMLMTIVSVPLTLSYLGAERFGLWMTVTSVVQMLAFADFGIGNGLVTVVAQALGREDHLAIRRFISSAFATLTAIGCAMLLVFFTGIYPFVDWAHVFNVQTPLAMAEAGPAIAALIACIGGNIATLIVPRVQLALQQGFINNLSVTLGLFASLAAIALVSFSHGSVAALVLAMSGIPAVAATINGAIFFARNPQYRPSIGLVDREAMRRILSTGMLFVLLQLFNSIAYASDKVIIARLLGAESVAAYSVYERVFGVGINVMLVMLLPIWPAYAEAWARQDKAWVKRVLRKSVALSLGLSTGFSAIIVVMGPLIVRLWTRKEVPVEPIVLYALGAWCILQSASNALTMFLNGLHRIRTQVVCAAVTAVVSIGLKFLLVPMVGPAGAVIGSAIGGALFTLLPFSIVVARLIRGTPAAPKPAV